MIDTAPLRALTEALLAAAARAGAKEADAIAVRAAATTIEVRNGALEHAERADGVEIGLRVLIDGRQACVSASETGSRIIEEMAERAVAMAREAPVDDSLGLAPREALATGEGVEALELEERSGRDPAPARLQELALQAEAAALAVPGVTMAEAANASFIRRASWIMGSNGFSGGYRRTAHAISAVAIAGEGAGMERDWAAEQRVWDSDMPSAEEIGRRAGERAAERMGARKPPTGAVPILYDQRVAASLIGHLLSAINGSAIVRGASWLRDAMGEAVLPPGLTLTDDPHRPRFAASRPFDAEGLPTAPRHLVEDGVLRSWLLDLSTARKLGLQSTASAARGTSSPPSPASSNVTLTPGADSPEALIERMGRGFVVTSMLGASVNPTTGDYSRGAAGFWVENGRIAFPVNECTIAGNLREMLMRLTPASDVPEWRSQSVPSLLVEGMTVAGA
ncbi:TldD/PmbA family protein [Paracoccus sp. S-4012]|uniref:TldD/PmbA family protein n=1 Tax=Paracoccus sp. S-4012 TaxID=2665648 RepID=UPI0012B101DD|nr:metallopeptidase TldD-related protein [Paracoccus sp. S-4012]MRX49813.1 TldD/PmbA family protein [Paracoccus sp. S-4012]